MALFKSKLEKRAEEGDKGALLELIRKGKYSKARKILERLEGREYKRLLLEVYIKEERFYDALDLLRTYPDLGSARERALIYERTNLLEEALKELLKINDFDSLKKGGDLLLKLGRKEEAIKLYSRALERATPSQRKELERKLEELREGERGLLERFKESLKRTRERLNLALLRGRSLEEEFFEELEEALIRADVGVRYSTLLVEELRKASLRGRVKNSEEALNYLKELLLERLKGCEGNLKYEDGVYILVGVNGSGKTTTAGKLAHLFKGKGKRVLLVGADTFRAGAIMQLQEWARRSGCDFFSLKEGADAGAVVYKAMERKDEYDVLIIDTAGRMHTKEPLMRELRKVVKNVVRFGEDNLKEVLLVLDATLGQNSLNQAKVFKEAVSCTGLIITKLDSSARGGALISVCSELKLPVKLVGMGEGLGDLYPFCAKDFVEGLLK